MIIPVSDVENTQEVGILNTIGTICGCRLNNGVIEYHIKMFGQKIWIPASYITELLKEG